MTTPVSPPNHLRLFPITTSPRLSYHQMLITKHIVMKLWRCQRFAGRNQRDFPRPRMGTCGMEHEGYMGMMACSEVRTGDSCTSPRGYVPTSASVWRSGVRGTWVKGYGTRPDPLAPEESSGSFFGCCSRCRVDRGRSGAGLRGSRRATRGSSRCRPRAEGVGPRSPGLRGTRRRPRARATRPGS